MILSSVAHIFIYDAIIETTWIGGAGNESKASGSMHTPEEAG